jgi:hypothetical protein
MNRAWIPAGALAGVSVAGLLAMGPLTDSMSTPVSFPLAVTVTGPLPAQGKQSSSVPVSLSIKGVGRTSTKPASLHRTTRGGQATSGSEGQVALKVRPPTSTRATIATRATTHTATLPSKPKKVVKRLQSIGTTGEINSDQGLAGGNTGKTSTGESNPTPSSSGS